MMTDVSLGVRAKRKRGRPRKDSNICRDSAALHSPENSAFIKTPDLHHSSPPDAARKDCGDEAAVGSMVYGVVEGSFDAGYLISVRIGTNMAPFRGVVFQPRKVVAVTAANDVAPQAKMYQRREIPVPVNLGQTGGFQPKQTVVRPLMPPSIHQPYHQSSFMAANEPNLDGKQFPFVQMGMVEEEEVMQTPTVGGKDTIDGKAARPFEIQQDHMICRETIDQMQEINNQNESKNSDLYFNENRRQDVNFFTDANSGKGEAVDGVTKSPNLKLDLAFTVQKEKQMVTESSIYSVLDGVKNPNIGYHHALVAGNPLLLPPDLIGEPLEFMAPPNCKSSEETNMEVQSRLVHGVGDNGEGAGAPASGSPYKLDFVLSNAVQSTPTQSNGHGVAACPSQTNQS